MMEAKIISDQPRWIRVLHWIPPLAWIGGMYFLLTKPISSEKLSWLPEHADKLIHFALFAILAWLLFTPVRLNMTSSLRKCAGYSFIMATAFGIWTEWVQSGLPHREADLIDVLANTLGAATIFGVNVFYKRDI